MTAQETYRLLIKEIITPGLRERGFRGGSGKYYLDGPVGHVGSVVFTKSAMGSTSEHIRFRVDIGVLSRCRREYFETIGEPISSRPSHKLDHDWLRELLTRKLIAGQDPVPLGTDLLSRIDRRALPILTRSLTDQGLRLAIDKYNFGIGGSALILLDIEEGNLDMAAQKIMDWADRLAEDDPNATAMAGHAFLSERLEAARRRHGSATITETA